MEYIKLIALKIGDFYSTIHYEDNFAIDKMNEAEKMKKKLTDDGYLCLIVKTDNIISCSL